MVRLEVTAEVVTVNGTKGGRAFSFQKQIAYAHIPGHRYPLRVQLPVKDQPVGAGWYTLGPDSVYVNRYGELALWPKLVSTPAPVSKSAAAA